MGLFERLVGSPLAERLVARLAGPSRPPVEERGATGTPNFGGFIVGEDYNPSLDGQRGMQVYDEMRRSDGQVKAVLLVVKLPLKGATWRIDAPKSATGREQEIADWVHGALFETGAMETPWQYVLNHLLMKLEFGVSVLEKVWTVADDGSWRLRKLAPRLPFTLEEWIEDEHGNLVTIVQRAWKRGAFARLELPRPTCVVSVHDQEGGNWFGSSILRPAYPHWFWKTQLYRIDAVKHDRWGVGIPEAVLDKDQTFSTDELSAIDRVLKGLRAHEKGYLRHSSKWELKIRTPEGSGSASSDLMASVDHHNAMIARSILAGFLSQGEQPHGSFGLGSRLTDFFTNALESVADDTCEDVNTQVVRPLCDLNFPMADVRYPKLTVSNLSDIDMKELASTLQTLGRHVTPDDDLEDVLRSMMNLPPLPKTLRGRREQQRAAFPQDGSGQPVPTDAPPGAASPTPSPAPASEGADGAQALARVRVNAARFLRLTRSSYVTATGHVLGRAPTPFELAVFNLHEIPAALDQAATRLAEAIAEVRWAQLDAILDELVRKDARDETGAFTDLRPSKIALPKVQDLERAIKRAQADIAVYGALQVQEEARRQGTVLPLGALTHALAPFSPSASGGPLREGAARAVLHALAAFPLAQPAVDAGKGIARSALVTSAAITAERLSDTWYGRILETALAERRAGTQGEDLRAAVQQRLFEEATKPPLGEARAEVNEAFAVGRAVEAQTVADQIDLVEYSALMDENTCGACADLDGEQFPFGSPRYYETMPPYRGCHGSRGRADACRCVHLFLFKGRTV